MPKNHEHNTFEIIKSGTKSLKSYHGFSALVPEMYFGFCDCYFVAKGCENANLFL